MFDQRHVPRSLGSLQPYSSCQLFGWGPTDIQYTRGDAITVRESQYCDPNLPQAFCSSHPTISHYSCSAMTGSPVTCGGSESIAGFLINNATCSSGDSRVSLNFHSVSQFTEWILNPTDDPNGAAVTTEKSIVFLLIVAFINGLINKRFCP